MVGASPWITLRKYNPYHDRLGRFASAPGGGGGSFPSHEGRVYASDAGVDAVAWSETNAHTSIRDMEEAVPGGEWTPSDALTHYQANGYQDINGYLRGESWTGGEGKPWRGKDPSTNAEVKEIVANLDAAMKQSTIPENVTLFRGVKWDHLADVKVGDVVSDKGYMSTSVSKNFARGYGVTGRRLEIQVPKGSHGVIAPSFGREAEVILPRGTKLRVLSVGEYDVKVRLEE